VSDSCLHPGVCRCCLRLPRSPPPQGLTDRGLYCCAALPALQHLKLSYCPAITACGLGTFLLSGSSTMRRLDMLCCAGVSPAEAQAVQDAVWAITHRRVQVTWSRHDPSNRKPAEPHVL
jgi:hypothetical protein